MALEIDPKAPVAMPEEPTPPSAPSAPDPNVERTRQLEEEYRRQLRMNEALQLQLLALSDRQPAPAAPVAAPPSREDDPDAYVDWQVKKRIEEELAKRLDPSVRTYNEDRKMVLQSAVEMSKFRVATKYPELWAEHGTEVERFLSAFPADVLAKDGAIEEALFREVGIKTTKARMEESRRQAAAGVGGGRTGAPPMAMPPAEPKLEGRMGAIAARESLTPMEHETLRGRGRFSIDEYTKLKEARK